MSLSFEEQTGGRAFSRADLDMLLAGTSVRGPFHTDPFRNTPDGKPEMVIVHATLVKYFVLATQTCDVCGIDKEPVDWVIMVPAIPLADTCKGEMLPFAGAQTPTTIHAYLGSQPGFEALAKCSDMEYATKLRAAFAHMSPEVSKKNPNLGRVKNLINRLPKASYVWALTEDASRKIPEAYADFSQIYTLERAQAETLMGHRIARIANPWRDQFAQKLGTLLSRIAAVTPMAPSEIR